ncbi:MAG: hypothetical protein LBB94_09685 [Clostridiales bacterium]|nr:hypothetical protein [Clostridiales bacterium]
MTPNGNRAVADKWFDYLAQNEFFINPNEGITDNLPSIELLPMYGIPDFTSCCSIIPQNPKTINDLREFLLDLTVYRVPIGSIVMNCNPFTLGHRYLAEYAVSKVKHLFIFVVEEDKSVFPFADRIELVKQGTSDLENVTVLPSGKFIISSLTFSDYFNKSELQDRTIDPSQDVELFAKEIAPALGITVRFAGEEPLDNVTRQYNDAMRKILPQYGVKFEVIPRKESGGEVISASKVRKLLETKDFDEIAKIVTETTFAYLKEKFGDER